MSDRELLELAAKAGGIEACSTDSGERFYYSGRDNPWNPLTDDGDALRLACCLGIDVYFQKLNVVCGTSSRVVEYHGRNKPRAVRRAIVRAAADIGRAMP